MSCIHCDDLLDELARVREQLRDRTWQRDAAQRTADLITRDLLDVRRELLRRQHETL